MKNIILIPFLTVLLSLTLSGCGESAKASADIPTVEMVNNPAPAPKPRKLSPEFKSYWYAGVAEVSSYALKQARYGEMREGEAVLIYVTEPFNAEKQVKANRKTNETPSVLKLNRVRKFLTGIYPYSIMSSIFYPVSVESQALKISTSVQEWCGHVYAQLNNRETFEIQSNSYFESEADQTFSLQKNILEDELWTLLRVDPGLIPTGEQKVIPSLEFLRLKHQPIKAYNAKLEIIENEDFNTLTLSYPDLNRQLTIEFGKQAPFRIEGWTESYPSGGQTITSEARLINRILSPYWQKNSNSDVSLRDSLGLYTP